MELKLSEFLSTEESQSRENYYSSCWFYGREGVFLAQDISDEAF